MDEPNNHRREKKNHVSTQKIQRREFPLAQTVTNLHYALHLKQNILFGKKRTKESKEKNLELPVKKNGCSSQQASVFNSGINVAICSYICGVLIKHEVICSRRRAAVEVSNRKLSGP